MNSVVFIFAAHFLAFASGEELEFWMHEATEEVEPFHASIDPEVFNALDMSTGFCHTLREYVLNNTQSAQRQVSMEDHWLSDKCKLYTADGLEILTLDHITPAEHLYVVPSSKHFVWPTIKLGHKVVDPLVPSVTLETISESPRIFKLHNFITPEEMERLNNNAENLNLERSTVGVGKKDSNETNAGEKSKVRTSSNAWDSSSPVAVLMKRRAWDVLRLGPGKYTASWFGGLQVVHYNEGEFYDFHQDWLKEDETTDGWNWSPRKGGINRFATIFLYLSGSELGGSTGFPMSTAPAPAMGEEELNALHEARDRFYPDKTSLEYRAVNECIDRFHVRPVAGEVILFYHQNRLGELDKHALHGACPVLKGDKLGANLWVWNGPMYSHQSEDKEVKVVFQNDYHEEVELLWIQNDDDDIRKATLISSGTIETGSSLLQNTWSDHKFAARTMSGLVIGKYLMNANVKEVVIKEPWNPVQMAHEGL